MRTEQGNKRIVSKGEYIEIIGGRFVGYSALSILFLFGISGMIFTGLGACKILLTMMRGGDNVGLLPFILIVIIPAFLLSMGMTVMARAGFKSIAEEEAVVPLTRQTALDIPAEESLVRASSAQTLADETILLRPAQAQANTASEELLRPHS